MPLDGTSFVCDITLKDLAVLRSARQYIARPDGWCQIFLTDGNRRCAMGALGDALREARMPGPTSMAEFSAKMLVPVLERPEQWIYPGMSHRGWAVSHFNDDRRTKKADVLALFDRGIQRAETLLAIRRANHPTRWERLTDRLRALFARPIPSPVLHDFHGSTMTNAPFSAVLTAADQNSSKTLSLA